MSLPTSTASSNCSLSPDDPSERRLPGSANLGHPDRARDGGARAEQIGATASGQALEIVSAAVRARRTQSSKLASGRFECEKLDRVVRPGVRSDRSGYLGASRPDYLVGEEA